MKTKQLFEYALGNYYGGLHLGEWSDGEGNHYGLIIENYDTDFNDKSQYVRISPELADVLINEG